MFGNLINVNDILLAAFLALIFTWIIVNFRAIIRFFTGKPARFEFDAEEVKSIMQKCYLLFPNDTIHFEGISYTRGMRIRVTTVDKKMFEGIFIGFNGENVLCVLTKNYIAADLIGNVKEIVQLEETVNQ